MPVTHADHHSQAKGGPPERGRETNQHSKLHMALAGVLHDYRFLCYKREKTQCSSKPNDLIGSYANTPELPWYSVSMQIYSQAPFSLKTSIHSDEFILRAELVIKYFESHSKRTGTPSSSVSSLKQLNRTVFFIAKNTVEDTGTYVLSILSTVSLCKELQRWSQAWRETGASSLSP